MARIDLLRKLSHISAAVLALHVGLATIYFSIGMVIGILSPQGFVNAGWFMLATGTIALAVFCVSTQFYLEAKRKQKKRPQSLLI